VPFDKLLLKLPAALLMAMGIEITRLSNEEVIRMMTRSPKEGLPHSTTSIIEKLGNRYKSHL